MIRKVNTNTANAWTPKTQFPTDNYIIRCIGEEVGVSQSSGNPMVTLEWEIVNCEPKQIGDELVDFDGTKFKSYHVTANREDEEKSNKVFKYYQDGVLTKCGIDVSEGWDDENPPSVKGKVVYALLKGEENKSYAQPTKEEREAGKKVGKVLQDPITGKDLVIYKPILSIIHGLFAGELNRPY